MNDTNPPVGLIPERLLQTIKEGDRVLFLGADWPLAGEGAPLCRPQLANALAESYDLRTGLAWPETAQAYLNRFQDDRRGLISFIAEHNGAPQCRPGPLHRAVARAGFRAIVTAWYDELLEEALRDAGYRVNRVVRDTQLAYAQEGEQEAIVVKLFGCLSDPESLVLTSWDYEELMDRLSRKLEIVTAFCALRPPLFLNWDLTTRMPMRLYVRASANMVEHMRRAYAVWPQPVDDVQARWHGKNVEFVQADATAFLQALSHQLPILTTPSDGQQVVRRPPYKFLDYYTEADAAIFCGRDTESQIVTRLALSHRVLTLFGPSGAGKTSLLLAGLVPRLQSEQFQHVYVRALDDPIDALRKAVAERAGRADWQSGADLRHFLELMLAQDDKLLIILDQFEELFLRVGSRQRDVFFGELAAVIADPTRDVRIIFSLREDYLAHLDEARPHLPDILGNSYRLAALARDNARVAITEPAARASVAVEPELVDALVGVEAGRRSSQVAGDLVEQNGHVPPAALQIVLDYLYRTALPQGYDPEKPPPPNLVLTLASYRDARHLRAGAESELHGAEAILAAYVGEAVERLPDLRELDRQTPLGSDPALGRAILKVMVTSQSTKAALTHEEIVAGLDEAGELNATDAADRELARKTRRGLEQVRLLRGFERDRVAYYELAHDHLAAEIGTWISEEEMQAKLARELLRSEMGNWQTAGLLIRPEVLSLIHARRDDLKRLGSAELELLLRSALANGYEAVYWFERARDNGVAVTEIVRTGVESDDFRTRAAATVALGQLGTAFVDTLIALLADDYPQVRLAALNALERLQPEGGWRDQLRYECYVPAGPFLMGSEDGHDDEKPLHEQVVDACYMGKYPVTNADYKRYMDDRGRAFDIPQGKERHPVVNVSWYDAQEYVLWANEYLSQDTAWAIRLPTEPQWEKAAGWHGDENGGKGRMRRYPWGDDFDAKKCNTRESGIRGTSEVGRFSPQGNSPYGCVDMAGNVWEWTSSLHREYPYRADDGREDMTSNNTRTLRGGSWYGDSNSCRVAYRADLNPLNRDANDGFRLCVCRPPSHGH